LSAGDPAGERRLHGAGAVAVAEAGDLDALRDVRLQRQTDQARVGVVLAVDEQLDLLARA
jgi:hypothetical protein